MSIWTEASEPLTETNITPACEWQFQHSVPSLITETPSQALIINFQQLNESTCRRQQRPLNTHAGNMEVTVVP